MAESLTIKQKKDWAQTLFLKEHLTQQEIAERVGVSRVTICRWVKDGKWEQQKAALTTTREALVANFSRQLEEINRSIEAKPEGERFPDSKQLDAQGRIVKSIKQLETEPAIADIISVLSKFIDFVRPADLDMAKNITRLADAFIKEHL